MLRQGAVSAVQVRPSGRPRPYSPYRGAWIPSPPLVIPDSDRGPTASMTFLTPSTVILSAAEESPGHR